MEIPAEESIILVATGQLIGEGFDMPRLDTLFLATPVSGEQINAIYDYESYHAAFEKDLIHAHKNIVISSPVISRDKIQKMIGLLEDRQIAGVSVTIETWSPDAYGFGDSGVWHALQEDMRQAGFVVQQAAELMEMTFGGENDISILK